MYGTPNFGNFVVHVSKPISNKDKTLWRLYDIISFDMPSVLFVSKAGLF